MAQTNVTNQILEDISDAQWESLSKQKIYFGHQSVGYNIISGIDEISGDNPKLKLRSIETYNPDKFEKGILAHSRIGYNTDPESKVAAFDFYMKAGIASTSDICGFKFCYVDVGEKTDINKLFDQYKSMTDALQIRYPETTFFHCTVPLTTIQTGYKAKIKKLLGRSIGGTKANIKRNEYNALLRAEYLKTGTLFDLAEIESTLPDGTRCTFDINGEMYYSLFPEYTNDGGHLNNSGRIIVADNFISFLASLSFPEQ